MAADRARTLVSRNDLTRWPVRLGYWAVFAILMFGALLAFLPLVWGFLSALKPADEVFGFPPTFFPQPANQPHSWNWSVYTGTLVSGDFARYYWNTALLAVLCWAAAVIPSALAGYALSKLRAPWKQGLILLFFMTLMVPFQAYLVPLFLTVRSLPVTGWNLVELFAGYPAIVLPAGVSAFNIFIFKRFFDDIPDSLLEAARMDGCGELGVLRRVVIPLSYAAIAVVSIFSFMGTWNDFLWPLLIINDNQWHTIMLRLYNYDLQANVGKNQVMAALMIASLPPLVVFAVFQRRIMQGIAMTGVKF